MKDQVFNFSLNTIKRRRQLVYIIMVFVSLMVLVLAYTFINESQYRINWNSNLIIVLTMILIFCIILFVINIGFYDIFNMIFMLGLSIFYFIYKPLSKSFGLKHKKYDFTMAVVIFLTGIIMLILI